MKNSQYHFSLERKIVSPKNFHVHLGQKDYEKNGIRVLPVLTLCKELDLP
jgi:hypothetical protein